MNINDMDTTAIKTFAHFNLIIKSCYLVKGK